MQENFLLFVYFFGFFGPFVVIDNRSYVSVGWKIILERMVNLVRMDVFKFWNIFFYVLAFWIKSLRLEHRRENSHRFRISSDRRRSLSVTDIDVGIIVEEMLCKKLFTSSSIDQQVFGEKWSNNHTNTIMHSFFSNELSHPSIDHRISSTTFASCFEQFLVIISSYFSLFLLKFHDPTLGEIMCSMLSIFTSRKFW